MRQAEMSSGSRIIQLYKSMPDTCGYLGGRQASNLVVDPELQLNPGAYQELLEQGFRRSGDHVYRPHCEDCQACIPVRIPVQQFIARQSHRRILKRNQDLKLHRMESHYDDEHFLLFKRYLMRRHADGQMANSTQDDYIRFLSCDWCQTDFLEWRLNGKLLAVAVTDRLPHALSAVYTFFDPEESRRSLGSYAILQQIILATKSQLEHLYIGYWIRDCQKMAYKIGFPPIEARINNEWQLYSSKNSAENAII